jgi:hypothetical protein
MKKMRYSEAPSNYHSNASRTNKFEDYTWAWFGSAQWFVELAHESYPTGLQ